MIWNAVCGVGFGSVALHATVDSPTGGKGAAEVVEKVASTVSEASPTGAIAIVAIAGMVLAGFAIYINRKK